MKLRSYNQCYEAIILSNMSQDKKDRELADLMTDMEVDYKIPALCNDVWETENRAVISLYRKISMSRSL